MNVKNARELIDLALDAAWKKADPELLGRLSSLAEMASVEFSENIDTACIAKSGRKYMVRFSRRFVENHLDSGEEVLFVLLHEIMHKVRGDLVRDMDLQGPADWEIANVAEDMLINAELCARFFPEPLALFDSLYDGTAFPDVMLTPPANLIRLKRNSPDAAVSDFEAIYPEAAADGRRRENAEHFVEEFDDFFEELKGLQVNWDYLPFFLESPGPELLEIYARAWVLTPWETVEGTYHAMRPFFPDNPELVLIGDHRRKKGDFRDWEEVLGNQAAGFSDREYEDEIDIEAPFSRRVSKVARVVRRALEPDPMDPVESLLFQPERSVVPWPGRKEMLWLGQGLWPVFFNPPTLTRDCDYLRPHIYIDVSASSKTEKPSPPKAPTSTASSPTPSKTASAKSSSSPTDTPT